MAMDDFLKDYGIAIIGMSGRFPGAETIQQFWDNLLAGEESISTFSHEELRNAGVSEELIGSDHYVPAKGVLENIKGFDAGFFNISPNDARLMDPQQRIFLECAWEAMEVAGYPASDEPQKTGVFAGVSKNTYLMRNLLSHPHIREQRNAMQALIYNEKDYVSTRTSYKLNLTGPSITVQTACSSSLVAVHLACQSLLTGECEMVLAGGASIDVPHKAGYEYLPDSILSPDGHCRVFDRRARGTVFGQGVGVVLLKPLAKALEDRDMIHAVIRGSAINNDGAAKVGFTAPSVDGQVAVIEDALDVADIKPEEISYLEAHGTGTAFGDPVEVEALNKAYHKTTDKRHYCALGSVKANLGHLNTAAGITGLIKTALVLQNRVVPPSIHFEQPNENIDFEHSPFFVNTELHKLDSPALKAGVSSLGIGGTNAHAILEAIPLREIKAEEKGPHLFPLSARSPWALNVLSSQLAEYLKESSDIRLADISHTLQTGRNSYEYRRVIICHTLEELIAALEKPEPLIAATQDEANPSPTKLAQDWLDGSEPQWSKLSSSKGYTVPLPTHPFNRQDYWIEMLEEELKSASDKENEPQDGDKNTITFLKQSFIEILGVESIAEEDNFFDLGGDSLSGTDLVPVIQKRFNVPFSLTDVYRYPSVQSIASYIHQTQSNENKNEQHNTQNASAEDLYLDASIQIQDRYSFKANPSAILLTGATGFLGSYILKNLLAMTDADLYCLVRAENEAAGLKRISENYSLYHDAFSADETKRIHCVLGDISKENLGIDAQQYKILSQKLDSIYHCAARLSFAEPYESLRDSNVESTRNIITLACTGKTKQLYHVSSIAAFDSDSFKGVGFVDEDQIIDRSTGFHSGYDETKWASEMLVMEARKRGLPATIFRPGNITGDEETGAFSPNDLIGRMFRGCLQLGYVPDNDSYVDLEPVSYVGKALVYISLRQESSNGTYHLTNPHHIRWSELVGIAQEIGLKVEAIPFEEWRERLKEQVQLKSDNPLISLLPMFGERPLFSGRRYRSENTLKAIAGSGIECPEVTRELMSLYSTFINKNNLL